MSKPPRVPHQGHVVQRMSRREVARRALGLAGVAGAGAYLAFAPEDYPLSLRGDEDAELQLPIETQTHDEQTTNQEIASDLSTAAVEPQPRSAYYNLRRRVYNPSPELPSRTRFTKRHRVQINSIGIQALT